MKFPAAVRFLKISTYYDQGGTTKGSNMSLPANLTKFMAREGDPNRCIYTTHTNEQCRHRAVEGSEFCQTHKRGSGGLFNLQLNLVAYAPRVAELANSPNRKNLGDELGVVRALLETRLNGMRTSRDFELYGADIMPMIERIERLVLLIHKIDIQSGEMLDKSALMQLGDLIIEIISRHVSDFDVLSAIANEIVEAVSNLRPTVSISSG